MTGAEIIAILSVAGTVTATLITTVFSSMALSRCTDISCCFDCFLCKRDVVSEQVVARQVELNAENNNI